MVVNKRIKEKKNRKRRTRKLLIKKRRGNRNHVNTNEEVAEGEGLVVTI